MSILNLFRNKIEQEVDFKVIKKVSGEVESLKKRLKDSSMIVLIVGKRGSGKSALGFRLLENISGKRKAYYIGNAKLPWWINQVDSIDKIRNDSLVLVDEAAITFSSRDSMSKSNKFLSEIMAIARHKNLTLILITQNSAMMDLNTLRLADTLIFKESSLLQRRFERRGIEDLFATAEKEFKKIKDDKKKFAYVFDDDFEGMIEFSLPSFWNEKISKSFSGFK